MLRHASAAMSLDVYSGLFDDDLDAVAESLDAAALLCPRCALSLGDPTTLSSLGPLTWAYGEPPKGIEPLTYALRVRRSVRLS